MLTREPRLVAAIHVPGLVEVSPQLVGVGVWGTGEREGEGGRRGGEGEGEGEGMGGGGKRGRRENPQVDIQWCQVLV